MDKKQAEMIHEDIRTAIKEVMDKHRLVPTKSRMVWSEEGHMKLNLEFRMGSAKSIEEMELERRYPWLKGYEFTYQGQRWRVIGYYSRRRNHPFQIKNLENNTTRLAEPRLVGFLDRNMLLHPAAPGMKKA